MKAEVAQYKLAQQVESARQRLASLYERAGTSSIQRALLDEALEELSIALEELQVSAEEMRQYNDELAAAQQEVEAERQRYRELFEFAPAGYVVTDPRGIIKEANSVAATMLNCRREYLLGKPMITFLGQEDHKTFFELLDRMIERDMAGEWTVQLKLWEKAGFFPAGLSVSRAFDGRGRPVGLRWLVRDITERKRAEEQLQRNLRRITALRDINAAISSTLDLQTVLDLLLEKIESFFPYPTAATVRLFNRQTEELDYLACRNIDQADWKARGRHSPGLRADEVIRSKAPLAVRNVQTEPRTRWLGFYIRNGLVSYLAVPLIIQEGVTGILTLFTKEEHEFTEEEIDFLSGVAIRAALAIYNSQLYEQIKNQAAELKRSHDELELRVKERTIELTKANEALQAEMAERKQMAQHRELRFGVTRVLVEPGAIEKAVPKLLRVLCKGLGWDFGELWLVDPEFNLLRCKGIWHAPSEEAAELEAVNAKTPFALGSGLPGRVWASGKSEWVTNVLADPEFLRVPMAIKIKLASALAFPIRSQNSIAGVIVLFSHDSRQPNDRLQRLISDIGSQIYESIERKRAEEALRTARDELEARVRQRTVELLQANEALKGEIAERMRTEEALRSSEVQFRRLLELAPDAIVGVDRHGRIAVVNAQTEKLFGYARNELLGQAIEILVPERFRGIHPAHREGYISAPRTRPMGSGLDLYARRKDGSEFPVEISLGPMRTDEGLLVTAIIRDIAERRRTAELERKLIASGRLVLLGEMAASLAHEFNNPLAIIQGFVQDLLGEVPPNHPYHLPLKIVEQETARCKKNIQALLHIGRPTPVDKKWTNIGEVIRKSVQLTSGRLRKGKVKTAVDLQRGLPRIYADARQLEQVLVNLLFNSLEAMPKGGKLTVKVMKAPRHPEQTSSHDGGSRRRIIISVSDTGAGIHSNDLPNIFRPFFSTKKKGGMGLGLAICESIVKAHDGRLDVESAPHQGTTFSIHLPVESK
ncbi:MAG: PAS domain S-box protein [Deltaproteobacteria bacterium]|nr:PAS domain S-box protein [Deltaproteobacteria bacterium]